MASSSFRESMNSLGWSRRADTTIDTSQQTGLLSSIKSLNPFGDSGYVRLPTTEGPGAPLPARTRREEEEGWFACESIFLVYRLQCPCVVTHVLRAELVAEICFVWLWKENRLADLKCV
jgi:hypothetical protein